MPADLLSGSGSRGSPNPDRTPATLLYSSRTLEDVIYRDEINAMARRDPKLRVIETLTRRQPEGWAGYSRRHSQNDPFRRPRR